MAIEVAAVKRAAYVRLGTKLDVPVITLLIKRLAEFEKLSDECHITEANLEAALFRQPAFQGPTALLLELGSSTAASTPEESRASTTSTGEEIFQEKRLEVSVSTEVRDPSSASASFLSTKDESRTVVGYTLFFPKYSTFLANSGLFLEDLYVREEYRRQGLGRVLLQTVAQEAAQRKLGRVEWSVLDWNVNAIKFYEAMGAIVHQEWRICRLSGEALDAYAG